MYELYVKHMYVVYITVRAYELGVQHCRNVPRNILKFVASVIYCAKLSLLFHVGQDN